MRGGTSTVSPPPETVQSTVSGVCLGVGVTITCAATAEQKYRF